MRFADITGLEEIKESLRSAVAHNHVAHAQLFDGPEGSANMALALAFASYVNCESPENEDSCGRCASCIKIDKMVHPDFHFVFPVSSTKKVSGKDVISASYLPEWREFIGQSKYRNLSDWNNFYGAENKQGNISKEESRQIIKALSLKAFEAKYKIMFIWLPEYMHPSAANGILKILEEPPERTLFLLVSNDSDRLLTTILSRTQKVKIRAFRDEELSQILKEDAGLDDTQASRIAQMADGNLVEAFKLIDNSDDDIHKMFRDWMRLCFSRDLTQLVAWADLFQKMTRVAQNNLFQYGLNIMRETLIHHHVGAELNRVQGEDLGFIQNFGKVMTADKVERASKELNTASYHLERNANPKILFLDLSLQLFKILRT